MTPETELIIIDRVNAGRFGTVGVPVRASPRLLEVDERWREMSAQHDGREDRRDQRRD